MLNYVAAINSFAASELVIANGDQLPAWKTGMLDIHHINTGRGDAAFMVFPDGTTLLFDVGSLHYENAQRYTPLKLALAKPNASKRPGEWVVEYIKKVMPAFREPQIDYALISHFHSDHFGAVQADTPLAESGDFFLTGITDVGESLPIAKLIDRAYPEYDVPLDLKKYSHGDAKSFSNYIAFLLAKIAEGQLVAERLIAGSNQQIVPVVSRTSYPEFSVRNIKVNGQMWSGVGDARKQIFDPEQTINRQGRFNENPYSLAIKINYGDFEYFTGGDMTGLQGLGEPAWFDVETAVAQVVGEVDVLTLNHHGNRDATNANFLSKLRPRVIVQQSWISDHPGGEVVHRMASKAIYPGPRDIFSTAMAEETKIAIGPWMTKAYTDFEGHVVIRVLPGGKEYYVFVLNDQSPNLEVMKRYGPYLARN